VIDSGPNTDYGIFRDTLDGGTGNDTAWIDAIDVRTNVETVHAS